MGEKLHTIIKALEQRMDSGVLHDLNITRLHMLIGDQLVKQSLSLPDDDPYIELIEKAMLSYFGLDPIQPSEDREELVKDNNNIDESELITSKPEVGSKQEPENISGVSKESILTEEKPVNFKLNIKKNEDNFQTIINQVPVIFSPLPVRKFLSALVLDSIIREALGEEKATEAVLKSLEEMSFVKTIQMLTDVFHPLDPGVTLEQKIRLGLVIYRLLGYGEFKIESNKPSWRIILKYPDNSITDMDNFSLGFIRGVFVAADVDIYNRLNFSYVKEGENTLITGVSNG